jgi:hypothetical protein
MIYFRALLIVMFLNLFAKNAFIWLYDKGGIIYRICMHFLQLFDSSEMIGILSTVILANVYGRDENNMTTKSL